MEQRRLRSPGPGEDGLPLAYRIVILQVCTALLMAAGMFFLSEDQALAALLAGLVCVIPAGYYAWRVAGERSPGKLLGQGVFKFVLTLVLMALVFAWLKPPPLGFFATLVLMQLMYVVGPLGQVEKTRAG